MYSERSQGFLRLAPHLVVIERRDEAAEITLLDLAPEKDVGADIEIVGKRQVLIDGFDAVIACIDRPGEAGGPALEEDLAFIGMIDARDAFDQSRFAGTVVAEERHHFAAMDIGAHLADRGEPAEALGQFPDRQERFHQETGLALSRPTMRSRD